MQNLTALGFNKSNTFGNIISSTTEVFQISTFLSEQCSATTLNRLNNFYVKNYLHSQCVASNITTSPVHIINGSTKFHPIRMLPCNPSSWNGIKETFQLLSAFFSKLLPSQKTLVSCDLVFFDKYYKVIMMSICNII